MTFSELALIKPILNALEEKSYINPTPIQQQAIPPILQGKDILAALKQGLVKQLRFPYPSCS